MPCDVCGSDKKTFLILPPAIWDVESFMFLCGECVDKLMVKQQEKPVESRYTVYMG
jgi:hypothetical protein